MEETEKSARREVFNYNRKFKEQLLSIKMKLENLQSEYGCSSNFLLIFEDNVTEKVNLRGRDSLTAGRTLCCGDGSLKEQFAKGEINFQPERMSFIRKGSCMQVDQSFLQDWAESMSRGVKRKREDGETTTEETSSTNTPDPSLGLLEPKVELLEPQEQLTEEGSSSNRVPVVKEEEVKKETIKQEPIDDVNLAAMIRDETVKISVGNLLLQNNEDKTGLGNSLLQSNKDKMGVGNLILQNNKMGVGNLVLQNNKDNMGVGNLVLQNNEDKRFSKIDPQLVKNAADARKRDYSMQSFWPKQLEEGCSPVASVSSRPTAPRDLPFMFGQSTATVPRSWSAASAGSAL